MDEERLESPDTRRHLRGIEPASGEMIRLRKLALSRWENEGGNTIAVITAEEPSREDAQGG